jgi:pimeloyl-ACP methyl ester carboxylesterase
VDPTGKVEVNGAHLYYEIRGTGHPLVLSHAGICDSRMWDDQMDAFAQQYQVIRYDHRGFGNSDSPPGPASISDDLHGLLTALGIARAHVLGVSMGGAAVIDFTLTHPEMVSALITVGSGLGGFEVPSTPEEEATFAHIEALVKAGDLAQANELEVQIWVAGPHRNPDQVDPTVLARVRQMNGDSFARLAENDLIQLQRLQPPAVDRLSEIRVPTLVIYGDQDVSDIAAAADKLAADIPGARQVVLRGTAHVPNMEQPAEFNRLVLDFLAGV